jgi:hypothetical protein
MASKPPPPGFNSSGNINNPTAFIEDFITKNFNKFTGMVRVSSIKSYKPVYKKTTSSKMLADGKEEKEYETLETINLTRIAASGVNNCCWFDTFLQCTSPNYRKLDSPSRKLIREAFRAACGQEKTINEIIKVLPSFMKPDFGLEITKEKLTTDITNLTKDIDWIHGYAIAWYFGVNLIYLVREDNQVKVQCQTSYQSPDCKTILIYHTGNHFEPVGVLSLDATTKLNEKESKFLFAWSDSALCGLKQLNEPCKENNPFFDTTWSEPSSCPTTNSSKPTSGGKRRKTRKMRKSKRKTTKSRRH